MGPNFDILHSLSRAGVEFIVGGGVACVLHGVERVTMDIDVAVHLTAPNVQRFLEVMTRLNLKPCVPVDPRFLADPSSVRAG